MHAARDSVTANVCPSYEGDPSVFQQGMPAVGTDFRIYTKIYLYIFIDTPNNML